MMINRVRGLLRPKAKEAPKQHYVFYTRGDQLLTPQEYQGGFEQALYRAIGGHAVIDDVTLGRAYGASAVALACTEYNATTTAGLPRIVTDPSGEVLQSSPLNYFLTHQAGLIIENTMRSLLIWGRCYLRKRYNPAGYPTGLEWLNPTGVREFTDGSNVVLSYDVLLPSFRYEKVPVDQIIYMQLFDTRLHGNGLSKFEAAWRALNIDFGLVTYAASFLLNGAQPDGMLTFDEEPEDIEQVKKDWQQFKGARNAHKTAIMPVGAKYTPIQNSPKDIALTEIKTTEREDVAAIFNVDLALIGMKGTADPLSANSTYSAKEVGFIRNVAIPYLTLLIFAALNEQWAHRDFDIDNHYTLKVDETAIPALAEANLTKAQTAQGLSDGNILDYDESRKILGYTPRKSYFIRTPEEALNVFNSGGISYHEFREYTMGIEPGDAAADMIKINGQFFPLSRVLELANANADHAIQMASAPAWPTQTPPLNAPPTPPQLPAGTEEERAVNSLCIGLDLSHHPDLVALQGRVREFYRDAYVEWNDPGDFHCTLLYAPAVDEEKMKRICALVRQLPVPALELQVGSLKTFDNLGNYALHFRIRRNADLIAFQNAIYEMVRAQGVEVSVYSTPTGYMPHITMGYMNQRPRAVTFDSKIHVNPTQVIVWQNDDVMFKFPDLLPAPPPVPPGEALNIVRAHSYFGGDVGLGTDAGCTFIVPLSPNEALAASGILIKALMPEPEQAVRWLDPADWHISLVNAAIMDDAMLDQVLAQLPALEAFSVDVGPLDTFDAFGERSYQGDKLVIILRVESEALRTLQRKLYDLCVAAGATVGEYSNPDAYQPHMTLAYAQAGVQLPAFEQIIPATVNRIVASRTDYQTIHQVEMVKPVVQRAAAPSMRVAVSFAENQFVKYACRELATFFTGQEVVATWEPESGWCLPLAQVDTWSPAQAARLIRTADYAETRKVDVTAGGYVLSNGMVYLACQSNEALAALRTSIELDLQDIAQTTITSPDVFGIALCAVPEGVSLEGAPMISYPLVANNLTLYKASRAEHQWALRGVPPAQFAELQRWERLIRRKGADYDFKLEVLDNTDVADFVRAALDSLVPIDDVFAMAGEALRGDLDIRAYLGNEAQRSYADTRAAFIDDLVKYIGAAQSSEIDKRNFGAKMRMTLRKTGLIAFRDGMNEVGYDPESFSSEELASFREWQSQQSTFVSDFSVEIFKEGITEGEVRARAEMWASMSLEDIRQRGILLGKPEQMMEWVEGDTIDKCPDCLRLAGQCHPMKSWVQEGWTPTSRKTACRSYNCLCKLVPTDKPEQGDY